MNGTDRNPLGTIPIQLFTDQKEWRIWSKINRDKSNVLIESGWMQAAGLRQIELAKADGRWDAAYDGSSSAVVPDDFQAALDANAKAQDFFVTLNRQNRYAILFRIHNVRKAETRARKIREFIAMLERHELVHG